MLQHFQLLYFSLIVWKALQDEKTTERARKTARRETKYNHKNMHTQKKCKFFQNKFCSTAVCAFLSTTNTNNFDCLRKKVFKSSEKNLHVDCLQFKKEPENYFSLPLCVNIFLASHVCNDAQLPSLSHDIYMKFNSFVLSEHQLDGGNKILFSLSCVIYFISNKSFSLLARLFKNYNDFLKKCLF